MKIESHLHSESDFDTTSSRESFSPPVHWSEKVLLGLISVHLAFLPWAIGSMHLWSQQVSLALAGIGFLAALVLNPPSTHIIPKIPAWKKLLKSPAFWIGTGVLTYIAIQALNPAYELIDFLGEPWVVPMDHITWLPSGMATPLEQMNAYRHLMIFGSVFMTIWTIGLFLERPKSIRFLLVVLTLNGIALGILAFAQLFTGADQIFWSIDSSNRSFYASFIYRNHASSYLNLLLAVSIGLYFYYRERAWKTNRSEPDKSPIFFFTSTILFTTILFSTSRGGVIVAGILFLLAVFYTGIQAWRWNRLRETSVISSIFLGLLVFFASVFTVMIGPERIIDRFKEFGADDGGFSFQSRVIASQATADMFQEKWLWGWGAGSFQYAFPKFQQNYPEIHYREHRRGRTTFLWEHAHNDWIHYPAEYGVAGAGLLLAGLLGWAISLYRYRGLRQPVAVWLALGVFLTLLHAIGDFVLQNPATLVTLGAVIALSLRSSNLESMRRRKREMTARL